MASLGAGLASWLVGLLLFTFLILRFSSFHVSNCSARICTFYTPFHLLPRFHRTNQTNTTSYTHLPSFFTILAYPAGLLPNKEHHAWKSNPLLSTRDTYSPASISQEDQHHHTKARQTGPAISMQYHDPHAYSHLIPHVKKTPTR